MIDKNARIFIAGHRGMVGSAIVRKFESEGYKNIIKRTHAELDLRSQSAVERFYEEARPEYVVLGAAKVGGIRANMEQKAEFMVENLEIQNNVIMGAYRHGVKKLCFLGSSCIYPCACPQPIKEDYLLTGLLEPTNEGYALAKISGYKLCLYLNEEYGFESVSLMPCNLYGTNDNYHPEHSHVFPALIRRFTEAAANGAKVVTLWGDGSALREFLHVDDVARAVYYFMQNHNDPKIVNIGYGNDLSIKELAEKIAAASGYIGEIAWDTSKPNGMKRKLMDISRAKAFGWQPVITLDEGIARTIAEFRAMQGEFRQ
ncbi:MAG: GDP-L-fucose synthase family protein [Victivallaceae bacterium]|nr:GDP-L-fucose synthase [Victivallaceae bacterium]